MKKLCAVIVSYNGDDKITELVETLDHEADGILIVDNGSKQETVSRLESLERNFEKVSVRFLNQNTGVAYALNTGLQYAREQGFKWLITFDQDTVPEIGAVTGLFGVAEELYSRSDRNVSFGPQLAITDDQTVIRRKALRGCRNVSYLITSGNLTLAEAAEKAGGWTDELFIDAVDYDFSLKLRSAGYCLWRCYQFIMIHQFGETNENGIKNTHNDIRKYYIIRNQKYLLKRYFLKFPGYCCFSTVFFLKGILRWFLTEKNKKEMMKLVREALKADIVEDYSRKGIMDHELSKIERK